jgi:ankyrin repeat protein
VFKYVSYFGHPCNLKAKNMKALLLLVLAFCLISLVSLSSSNDSKRARDEEDDRETSEPTAKLQKIKAPCTFCKTESDEITHVPKCGHPHHPTCMYKAFLSDDPSIQGKCSECHNEINYYSFIRTVSLKENMPDGIFFIQKLLDANLVSALICDAIKVNNPNYIRNLLKQKVPFNEFPIKGHSVLALAAVKGTPEILDILFKSGLEFAPVHMNNFNNLFQHAVKAGNVGNMRYLHDQGVDVNFIKQSTTRASIHEAIVTKRSEAIKLLIEWEANINLKSKNFGYPIHIAIERGMDNIVDMLLKARVDVSVLDRFGRSPLASACYLNKLGAVKLLLSHGCRLDFYGADGYNLLHYAIIPGSFEVAEYLLSINANIQMKDGTPSYALHRATFAGHTKMVKYLLKIGANPYEKCDSQTFLLAKAKSKLLERFCSSDSAIVIAILNKNKEMVEAFLEAGINASARILNSSSTLLHFALQNESTEIAELLIIRGADIHALDVSGATPFSYTNAVLARSFASKCSESL